MKEKAEKLREKVRQVLASDKLHDHQRNAANKTFCRSGEVRAVVTAAEMQAGNPVLRWLFAVFNEYHYLMKTFVIVRN